MKRIQPWHPSETEESLKKMRNSKNCLLGNEGFCFHGGFLKIWTNIFPEMVVYKFSESGHYLLERLRSLSF